MSLDRLYRRYNKEYFGGRLPKKLKLIMFEGKECQSSRLGIYVTESCYIKIKGEKKRIYGPLIMIRTDQKDCWVKLTLLHEMNHVDTEDLSHGRRFQKGMLRLARTGAFNSLW